MAVRDDFTAGEVLAAADLNDTFASKPPFAYGTATPTTTVEGFIWYDENDTPPAPKFWDGAAFQGMGGGKILQVVRATDVTERTTTSTTYVDVTGMSVTITPQKSTSAVLLIASFNFQISHGTVSDSFGNYIITDSSNNTISGAENNGVSYFNMTAGSALSSAFGRLNLIGYATPATTSAVTYKLRFLSASASVTARVRNNLNTGQMYAIEVSA